MLKRFSSLGAALIALVPLTAGARALVAGRPADTRRISFDLDVPAVAHMQDAGGLPADQVMEHVQLLLRRPASSQQALDALVHDQLDPASPRFRHWLQPADLKAYGASPHDIDATAAWLVRHGLRVNIHMMTTPTYTVDAQPRFVG